MSKEELAKAYLEKAVTAGLSLGSVESLTGGLFASTICSIPGASRVFKGAVVSYANEIKEHLVGVSPDTIAKYGVVSAPVAREMALGGIKALDVDVAVSFTGNAGPTAEPGEAPVGRVYLGLAFRKKDGGVPEAKTFEKDFKGDRNTIREACVSFILEELLKQKV
jgi:PncC family amidohydrolase